jgi:hypothetical protein
MDLPTLQVAMQSMSSVIIAGGLIFAGLQFRHWRRVAHVANFTKMVELQMHLREMRVHDPSLASVYAHDVEGRRGDREIREYFFNLMQLSVFEIVWFSHREGLLPDDYFRSWESRMEQIAGEESFRAMFDATSMKILHDGFQRYVEDMVRRSRRRDP